MRKLVLKIIANITAFYCAAWLIPEITLKNTETAIGAGLILGCVNLVIRPLLFLVTLPVNFITLGLFTFILNTWMIMLTDGILPGLEIPGFWLALFTALIVSVCNLMIQDLEK